jgi:hypothetical protein
MMPCSIYLVKDTSVVGVLCAGSQQIQQASSLALHRLGIFFGKIAQNGSAAATLATSVHVPYNRAMLPAWQCLQYPSLSCSALSSACK